MKGRESSLDRLLLGFWLAKEAVLVVRVLILRKALEQREAMELELLELLELDLVSCGRCIVACGILEGPKDFL